MRTRPLKGSLIFVIGVFLLMLPAVIPNLYFLHVVIIILFNTIVAMGLNLVLKVGQVSLGQAAFMAIGAYTSTILVMKTGLSYWLTLPISGLMAGIVGAILGYPALRLRGVYFVIVTFCFGEAIVLGIRYSTFLGGNNGIMNIPPPNPLTIAGLLSVPFNSKIQYYYLLLFLAALTILVMWRLHKFRFGRALVAIGENPRLAEGVGINLFRYKMTVFTVACAFAGVAGAVFAPYFTYVHPSFFGVLESFFALLYVLVGGPAYFTGPIVGTTVLIALDQTLGSILEIPGAQEFTYGIVLVSVMIFLPKGLMSFSELFPRFWRTQAKGRPDGRENGAA
jgi:branched-chain amino acid transport system permease protein